MTIVGEAANGQEAITQALELHPDVILMDLYMPELSGVEATRQIVQSSPHTGILVLTMLEDDASVFAAMRAGARGYLLKGADQAEVLRAITKPTRGHGIIQSQVVYTEPAILMTVLHEVKSNNLMSIGGETF